jgi:hypothetical protein
VYVYKLAMIAVNAFQKPELGAERDAISDLLKNGSHGSRSELSLMRHEYYFNRALEEIERMS